MSSVKLLILLFSGLSTLSLTFSELKCQHDWLQFESRCFRFSTKATTWKDAELNCVTLGGHLASVHSLQEYTFIQALVLSATGSNAVAWLGASDEVEEGVWVWTDKSPFDYTYWATGEPSNTRLNENHLEMNYRGQWNDYPETNLLRSTCAKSALPLKTKKVLQLKIISNKDLLQSDIEELVLEVKNRLIASGMPSYNTLRIIKFYKKST